MNKYRQSFCLNMIVKNEAPVIRRCLDSVRPIIAGQGERAWYRCLALRNYLNVHSICTLGAHVPRFCNRLRMGSDVAVPRSPRPRIEGFTSKDVIESVPESPLACGQDRPDGAFPNLPST